MDRIEEICRFWLGEDPLNPLEKKSQWYKKDPEFDATIKQNFESDIQTATTEEYSSWRNFPRGNLALVLLHDQFPRNVYRDTKTMYKYDALALHTAKHTIRYGMDLRMTPVERLFIYMPFMHSEELPVQIECLRLFEKLLSECKTEEMKSLIEGSLKYAKMHYDIVDRWGRFPHRNEILGRESTAEELAFLKEPNSSF